MKKIFTKLMLLAVAATALVSCANNFDDTTVNGENNLVKVTLAAEKPAEVRTQMIEGVPYWSAGDKIGVYTTDKNMESEYSLTNDSTEASLTTTFTGTTELAETIFVFYPSKGYGSNLELGAKTEIPAIQAPTATSFDGAADIMFAKPVTLDASGKQLSNLEFARLGAIVKIVLKDQTGNLAAQHISALTMTAESNLTGRVYLDVVNQTLGELYYGQAKSVKAEYTDDTHYEINGTNATYVIVYPQTLKSGSTLSFEASTEGYAISKTITLTEDIVLESGKVTTLNVSLTSDNVAVEATGLALPFEDDFSWVTTTSTTAYQTVSSEFPTRDGAAMYSAVSYAYPETAQLKFGSSSYRGYITTSELDLSQPFTVVVSAKRYGSDTTSQLQVTVGEQVQTTALGETYTTYMFKFDAAGVKEKVRFDITGKRGYINNIIIVAGHDYVLPPVLAITQETLNFTADGGSQTVDCTITNEVSGVSVTATESVDWLETSISGTTVTITATANEGEAREAKVTIAYEGAESKTVTVSQAAPVTGEAESKTYTFTITKADFNTTSYAANNNEKTSTATAEDGSTMEVKWTSNQVMQQSSTMQWQKSKGCIYNSTDLGTINNITIDSTGGTFTKYINSSQQPTSNGTGGYFQIKVGTATGKVNSITVTFTK